jgi:hypothetical protein
LKFIVNSRESENITMDLTRLQKLSGIAEVAPATTPKVRNETVKGVLAKLNKIAPFKEKPRFESWLNYDYDSAVKNQEGIAGIDDENIPAYTEFLLQDGWKRDRWFADILRKGGPGAHMSINYRRGSIKVFKTNFKGDIQEY